MPTDNAAGNAAPSTEVVSNLVERAAQRRQRRSSAVPYTDIAVCIGMKDELGIRKEIVHQIQGEDSDIRIVNVEHKVTEKTRQCKEDGQLVGFEPTGEYELVLKVKYIKD